MHNLYIMLGTASGPQSARRSVVVIGACEVKAKVVCICDGSKAGRKKGITSDLPAGAVLTEVFCPQIVCTCCSLCPNAAPYIFPRPVSASSLGLRLNTAAPGSLSLSAGGSPARVSEREPYLVSEWEGRARLGRSVPGLGPGRAPRLSSSSSRETSHPGAWPVGHEVVLGFGVPSPQCRAL